MKKLLLSFMFSPLFMQGQTFTGTTGGAILDNTEACFTVTVTGLANQINSSFGLSQVCVNLTHTYDSDLKLKLKSPTGTIILLASNNGNDGDNFTNTCFANNGANGSINAGTAPFTGTFVPFQTLNAVNNNQDPNGIWSLCVQDEVPSDQGTFIDFSITFSNNPPIDPVIVSGPCGAANGAACLCPDGTQDCDLLPDMTASAMIIATQHTETPGLITLSNATPNIGWGPMEIHGSTNCYCGSTPVSCTTTTCPDGSYPKQQLKQTIYHKSGSTITSRDTLTNGVMSYHPTHGHIHVDNWAEFTLRKATSNPDATTWPIVSTGTKMSFCLINLGNCTSSPGYCRDGNYGTPVTMADIPNSPFGQVSGCGTDQGIYVGNLDIYSQGLAGMSMDLTGVCNGDYYIVTITDPDNNFVESKEDNNWAATPITLTQQLPQPIATFTYTTTNNEVQFINPPSINLNYQWFFGDGGLSSNQNPSHTYTTNNTFYVTLIVDGNCGSDTLTQPVTILTNNISKVSGAAALGYTAYPNPITESTTVSYFVPEKSEVMFELYDVLGNRITTLSRGTQDTGHYEYNYSTKELGLSKGVYFLKLSTQSLNATIRLVKLD